MDCGIHCLYEHGPRKKADLDAAQAWGPVLLIKVLNVDDMTWYSLLALDK